MYAAALRPCGALHRWRRLALAVLTSLSGLLIGCAAPAGPQDLGVAAVAPRCPGERELIEGTLAYEEGRYERAETSLLQALDLGLSAAADRARAFKLIAFIACTNDRPERCQAAFMAARAADPTFELKRAEAGHPLWGPVYRRAVQHPAPAGEAEPVRAAKAPGPVVP